MLAVNKKALIDALTIAKRFTFKKPSHSELKRTKFSVQNSHLCLTSTDLDNQAEITIPANGSLTDCLIDPKELQQVLKMRPGVDVELALDDSRLVINNIPAVPLFNIDQFPALETDESVVAGFELPAAQFKTLFASTTYCMAKNDVRYYLNGALMECHPDKMRLVATDGHRMALTDTELKPTFTGDVNRTASILQNDTITRLLACIKKTDKRTVKVKIFGTTHISLEMAGLRVFARLIEGKYPNYEAMLTDYSTRGDRIDVVFNTQQLLSQLQVMHSASTNKFKSTRLYVVPGNAQLYEADTIDPETKKLIRKGDVKLDLQCEVKKANYAQNFTQGFNMDYLIATLKQISTEQVQFLAIDPKSSAMLTAMEPNATTHIIMPVRL